MAKRKKRGFALLTAEQRREMARVGGRMLQAQGKAHRWTSETASLAGKKGVQVKKARRGEHG